MARPDDDDDNDIGCCSHMVLSLVVADIAVVGSNLEGLVVLAHRGLCVRDQMVS